MLRVSKCVSVLAIIFGLGGVAHAADLTVSRYQVVDPSGTIYRGADVTFEVDVDNNDLTPITDAELEIAVPATMIVSSGNLPASCSASGFTAPQTLTCSLPTLTRDNANPDHTFTFVATAETADALPSTATVSSPTNTDSNSTNDSLTITPTVGAGADVSISFAASVPSIPAGGRYDYAVNVDNNGPDSVDAVQVTVSLPPSNDFGYVSATGSGWSCVQSGGSSQTVTCDYSGSAITSGASFPEITITGDADIQSGTLSAQADVTITEIGIGDPDAANNVAGPEVVTITPGTDLEATITIQSSFITGDSGDLTLTIDNNGPTSVSAGATIVHTLSSNLVLDGALPAGCVESTGTITCTAGALSSGGSESFIIPVSADSDTGGNQVISATVAPPSGISDPVSGNDTGSDTFRIDDPAADLFLQSKNKSPNPVEAGQNMTSTIRIENAGPSVSSWSVANPIVITDDLGPDETYVSVTTSNWSCVTGASPEPGYTTRVTCTTTDSGTIAVDARKTLRIVTQAGAAADADITNNACVDPSGLSIGDPSSGNNCQSETSRATTEESNLTLVTEVSLTSGGTYSGSITIPDSTTSHFIRLTLSNAAGSDTARTVNITTTDLTPWMDSTVSYNGGSVSHETAVSVFSADADITCPTLATSNDNITCVATDLLAGETRTIILEVQRPILSGTRTTDFSIASPDTVETDTSDNDDSVTVTAVANADLIVNDKRVSPSPAQSGGTASYLVDIKNIGPNTGETVASADFIDPTLFEVLSVTTTAPSGVCDYGTTTPNTATCTMGSVASGETYQMAISVRPLFPFSGASASGDFPVSHTNTATVTTTTYETDGANNSGSLTHDVDQPDLDLQVTNSEPSGFTEPSVYPDTLLYEIVSRNGGITMGSGITTTVTPNPPSGYEMAYNAGASTLPSGVACAQASNTDPVICTLPDLANNDTSTMIVAFDVVDAGGGAPISSITFGSTAVITSDQQDFDTPTANNTAAQTTTVIPSTDLEMVSKTRTSPVPPAPINIAEPVVYEMVFRNNGASATTQVRVTDTLPDGFERTATTVTFTPSGTATISGSSCTTGQTVTCIVDGFFPANGDSVTMTLEAAAVFPFTGDVADPIVNNVSIAVGQTAGGDPISIDENSSNNATSLSDGALQVSSISGRVYDDADRSDGFNGSEGIGSVTLTLTGTDLYGNTISVTTQTASDGTYTFADLPPSNGSGYTITETQPPGYFDYNETAGTASGTVDNSAYGSGAALNQISGIILNEDADETGYEFANYAEASVSGSIYSDLNNNGTLDGAETGIGSGYAATPHLSLIGTDYAGNAVNETASVNGSGDYTFTGLPPSDGSGYTLTQLEEPSGFYDGLEENGAGNTLAGTVSGTEQIALGSVDPGAALDDRNFGQVAISTLSGLIYLDDNGDGSQQGGETGLYSGGVVELTGTDDLARSISCSITTTATGAFSFPTTGCTELRPGTYTLTLTSSPGRVPSGTTAGVAGGTTATSAISAISLEAGTTGTGYLFGVEASDIVANDDDFTSTPINGADGGNTASVFPDDRLNSAVFADGDVIPSILDEGGLTGVSINSDGTLTVPSATPAGTYTVRYQICETLNASNCDFADAIILIEAPSIAANDNDFTTSPIIGATGGTTASVFPDDRLNDVVFADGDVIPSILDEGGLTGVTINADGTLNVPAGTPSGTYTVRYQICETLNPTNCDFADAIVEITSASINASNDDFTATPIVGADGGTTASVFPDDRLNDAAFADGDVIPTILDPDGLTGVSINADGTLVVPAATPAGTYSVEYQICEALNPTNCDEAFAEILVVPAEIIANDDDFTSTPINGADGGNTASVFPDDRLNDAPFADGDVTPSILDEGGLTGVSINSDGTLTVPPATPAGTYTVRYQICETLNPTNCDFADAIIVIEAAEIIANDNDFTASPIIGADGGDTASVFPDDRLNDAPFADGDVIATILDPDGLTGVTIHTDGTLVVPPTTPAGTYSVQYQICETLNPANCDWAIADILVTAADIIAEDDDYSSTMINGADGASLPSILSNDMLNDADIDPDDITITLNDDGGLTGLVINSDGTIEVPPGTPAGDYVASYQICENLNPTNCHSATITLTVTAPEINADDNDYSSTPVNGAEGGTLPSVYNNDTLNDVAVNPADITSSITDDGGLTGVSINSDGTLTVPPGSLAGTYSVTYQICEIVNPTNCDTAIITIVIVTDASVAGTVFLDTNANDTLQAGETLLPGYRVELQVDGVVIETTVSGTDGGYAFLGLDPDLTYELVFIDPQTGTIVDQIEDLDLAPGEDRTGLDLPLEPSGVVYDVATDEPVIGGIVTVVDTAGDALPATCFMDESQQGQQTSAEGYYFVDIVPGAAAACPSFETTYRIVVTLPSGLTAVFATDPEDVGQGALDTGLCPIDAVAGPVCEVSAQPVQPDASNIEPFYAEISISDGDPEFANNHIPVNSNFSQSALLVTKQASTATASVGSIVIYTITIINEYAVPQVGVDITDRLPAGLVYVAGSGRIDGLEIEPQVVGRDLTWSGINIDAQDQVSIVLAVAFGSGVTIGEYTNTAFADNGPGDLLISNLAEASVRVVPDEVFDCSEVIGKVFDDKNNDGVQSEDEPGLAGVRLATVKGLLVTTDEFGRYHIACAATPKAGIGSNFILKVDPRTLPTGFVITTENPRVMRLTQGKMSELNFGATLARPVEFQLTPDAFIAGESGLTEAAQSDLEALLEVLLERRSVLRITYFGNELAQARLEAVRAQVEREWADSDQPYELIIEIEAVSSSQNP